MPVGTDALVKLAGTAGWLFLAAGTVLALLLLPLPVRLRARLQGHRLLIALDVGWRWLAYRHRARWPAPHQDGHRDRRTNRRFPAAGGATATPDPGGPRASTPAQQRGPAVPALAPVRVLLRAAGGRDGPRLDRLFLQARVGAGDAAATALATGALAALGHGLAAVLATRTATSPAEIRVRVEPSFDRPRLEGRLDCIARVRLWDIMRAMCAARRTSRPAPRRRTPRWASTRSRD